jgi:hypothetical protein
MKAVAAQNRTNTKTQEYGQQQLQSWHQVLCALASKHS